MQPEPTQAAQRIWFVNTDKKSFIETPRHVDDNSPFRYWLAAGRLYVTPNPDKPNKYGKALDGMQPGDPVFAYENGAGFVALGWVRAPKDLRTGKGGTALYPKPLEIVRSLAVEWDTSVRREMSEVSRHARVGSHGLQLCEDGVLYDYLLGLLEEADRNHHNAQSATEAVQLASIAANPNYSAKTRAQIVQSRIGQGAFRRAVLAREQSCRLTGITNPDYLVASHIKPWVNCERLEHLDGDNGLMLAPHVDHLFDTGRISFENDGRIKLAPLLDREVLSAWGISETANVGPFSKGQAHYLAYHRLHVFMCPRSRQQRNLVGDQDLQDGSVDPSAALITKINSECPDE
jgi:hypothetical protein